MSRRSIKTDGDRWQLFTLGCFITVSVQSALLGRCRTVVREYPTCLATPRLLVEEGERERCSIFNHVVAMRHIGA